MTHSSVLRAWSCPGQGRSGCCCCVRAAHACLLQQPAQARPARTAPPSPCPASCCCCSRLACQQHQPRAPRQQQHLCLRRGQAEGTWIRVSRGQLWKLRVNSMSMHMSRACCPAHGDDTAAAEEPTEAAAAAPGCPRVAAKCCCWFSWCCRCSSSACCTDASTPLLLRRLKLPPDGATPPAVVAAAAASAASAACAGMGLSAHWLLLQDRPELGVTPDGESSPSQLGGQLEPNRSGDTCRRVMCWWQQQGEV